MILKAISKFTKRAKDVDNVNIISIKLYTPPINTIKAVKIILEDIENTEFLRMFLPFVNCHFNKRLNPFKKAIIIASGKFNSL